MKSYFLEDREDERPECSNSKIYIDPRDPAYDEGHRYVSGRCIKCGLYQYDPEDDMEDSY